MQPITLTSIGSKNSQNVTIYNEAISDHPLLHAIKGLKAEIEDDPEFKGFIEELMLYKTDRTMIGLEGKLRQAQKEELLDEAMDLKEKFAKKLEKEQLSITVQNAYVHILSYIKSTFKTKIKPLLQNSASASEIDSAIHAEIVLNIYGQTSSELPDLTPDHIAGMLYYLTGNCHISWRT